MTRKRLGRGLDGLLPAVPPPTKYATPHIAAIEEVHPAHRQPRNHIDPQALAELAASIQEHGVLEPILVRNRTDGDFEIIAGERRWRAAQQVGLKEVPIFVHKLDDGPAFEAALVENLQREDLNPIETARAFQRLSDEYNHTQEAIALKVGKERSTVANSMRLLRLPDTAISLIESGQLSEGHGRALLSISDPAVVKKIAHTASAKRWSVRETERQVRRAARGQTETASNKENTQSANVRTLENQLSRVLGSTTKIRQSKREQGEIRISFASYEELDRLIEQLTKHRPNT